MNTGSRDEREMLANIDHIATSLNRIANVMEAHEARARRQEERANDIAEHYLRLGQPEPAFKQPIVTDDRGMGHE